MNKFKRSELKQPLGARGFPRRTKLTMISLNERVGMGFLLDLLEVARQRRRVAVSQFRASFQPPQASSKVFHYSQGTENQEPKIPLFGSGRGFGLDWSYTRAPSVAPQGIRLSDVPGPIKNRRSSTVNLPAQNLGRGYEDPNISRTFRRTSEETDQLPIRTKYSSGVHEPVLTVHKRQTFETAERPKKRSEPEPSIASDPYSFY